jgi:hypothetical protein
MESKLALHFFFLVTFCISQLSLEAQASNLSDCQELSINPNIVSACVYGSQGEVSLDIEQGLPPYRVSWEDGSTATTRKLPAGNYAVEVTDALGCEGSIVVNVPTHVAMQANAQVNHTSKEGKLNGSIEVLVNGGTPPYRYTWISSQLGVIHAAIEGVNRVRKIPAGKYQVLIFDASGCYLELNTEVR